MTTTALTPNIELGAHLTLLAVTPQLIAVNKPAGMHSAPLRVEETSTVLNALMALHPECGEPLGKKALEGALVHRLDGGTSGVLVFARSQQSYTDLRALWSERAIQKDYLAWVSGSFETTGTINLALAHSPKSKKRMVVVPDNQLKKFKYWDASSSILPLSTGKEASLVLVRIHTGVTHQIRATLAALGHAVLGDPIYRAAGKPLAHDLMQPLNKTLAQELRERALRLNNHSSYLSDSTGAGVLANSGNSCHSRAPRAIPSLIPEGGFFLHAYALQSQAKGFDGLSQGLIAPPPQWFGFELGLA